MNFLSSLKSQNIPKSTFFVGILFVISFVIGVGGGTQFLIAKYLHFKPSFELSESSVFGLMSQLGFHLLPFVFGIIGTIYVTTKLFHQPVKSLFGDSDKLFQKLLISFVLYVVLAVSFLAIRQSYGEVLIKNRVDFSFSIVVFVLIVFVFIQILFEELLFRAFLPQTFVGFGLSKVSSIILASTIFGLLHNSNPEVIHYGKLILILYIVNGLFLGFITYLDNSIWLAIGYHFANNFLSLVFISSPEQVLKVPSLFTTGQENNNLSLLIFQLFVTIVIFFAVGFKLYRWKINQRR